MSTATQTNVQTGDVVKTAGESLTDLEGRLVKVTSNSGAAEVALPTAITDLVPFLLVEGGAAAANVICRPVDGSRNVRVTLKGTCVPGDVLVLADPTMAADKGKLRVLPVAAGTYRGLAIAEESGVDGQLVLCRPSMIGNIVVSE